MDMPKKTFTVSTRLQKESPLVSYMLTYRKEHPELGINKCAQNLGVSKSALSTWTKIYTENEGSIPTRGRGNFESDEAKEIARLKKELRDTQDALEILKKAISILGK